MMERSELAPKVKATYQAVIQLLMEGADLNNLTVSEITAKAGIGKGTVYEYFSNKEDMIAGALLYELRDSCERLYSQMKREKSLYDKMNLLLKSMEISIAKIGCFARVVCLMTDNSAIGCKMREMSKNRNESDMPVLDMIHRVIEDELETGEKVPKKEQNYLEMAIFSRMICFAMYQFATKEHPEMDIAAMREMICRDICRSLETYRNAEG